MSPSERKARKKDKKEETMLTMQQQQAAIKKLQEAIKKMKSMSPGERKARTGSATGRRNLAKPGTGKPGKLTSPETQQKIREFKKLQGKEKLERQKKD